jgi:putative DNA primase/helicase
MPLNIQHDGEIDIAVAKSRHETNWRNKTMPWSDFLDRVAETQRTADTYAEYCNAKKDRQAELKDVGGYVAGRLTKGKRRKGSVAYRSMLTLDLDFAPLDLWDNFTMLYDAAACLYSTHAHSSKKPRYRLILPLDRHVLPDEYEAIARRIAGSLNIEWFDDTTFQPERLMYWPSTSKDGEFVFEYQDGEWLNADDTLALYHDWTDSSEWPVSDRAGDVIRKAMKKAGDPTEKPGIVGAFCRTYTLTEAIAKYLPDVYTSCDNTDSRYTYAGGTTAAGLVVYEDKWAYSHHGTDPASMQLCNAWDLVRIHLYGLRDEDSKAGTPVNKLPSQIEMEALATKDEVVRKLVVSEKIAEANLDFDVLEDEDGTTDETVDDDWQTALDTNKKGEIACTVDNMVIILTRSPELRGRIAYDEFSMRPVLLKNVPWRKVTKATRYITDMDLDNMYHHLERVYGLTAIKLDKALNVVYSRQTVHPVREYLDGLRWDGVKRADTLLIDYLGAEDNRYTRAVTRVMMLGAVARIYEPGVKFETVLLLIGQEGRLKSTLFAKLARNWFSDDFSFNMIKDKRGVEQLLGNWIIEIPEMSGYRKTESNDVKGYISRQVDDCRLSYDRTKTTRPRQNIFVSCSNEWDALHANNGNRRIHPVRIDVTEPRCNVHTGLTAGVVDQLWAEIVTAYKGGEHVYLSAADEKLARAVQLQHTETDELGPIVEAYLDTKLPEDWDGKTVYERRAWLEGGDIQLEGTVQRERVCLTEIFCDLINSDRKYFTHAEQNRIKAIMNAMPGWRKSERRLYCGRLYGAQFGYVRATAPNSGAVTALNSIKLTKN